MASKLGKELGGDVRQMGHDLSDGFKEIGLVLLCGLFIAACAGVGYVVADRDGLLVGGAVGLGIVALWFAWILVGLARDLVRRLRGRSG